MFASNKVQRLRLRVKPYISNIDMTSCKKKKFQRSSTHGGGGGGGGDTKFF